MAKRKILVTGAVGKIAGQLLPAFQKQYDLTLLDISKTGRTGNGVPGVQIADLCDPNRETYRHHFKDIDHLGQSDYILPKNLLDGVAEVVAKERQCVDRVLEAWLDGIERRSDPADGPNGLIAFPVPPGRAMSWRSHNED